MNLNDVQYQMKRMWKDAFHDSQAYIDLLFRTYFKEDNIEYIEENGKIISSLFAIPYSLYRDNHEIKGRYLCGLTTLQEHRGNGIMTSLINKVNDKYKSSGNVFTFLIPANDSLRFYYQRLGYQNSSYRVENRFTEIHDFRRDFINSIKDDNQRIIGSKIKSYDLLNVTKFELGPAEEMEEIDEIVRFIMKQERHNYNYSQLLHTKEDLVAIIKENNISGGCVILTKKSSKELSSVLFISHVTNREIYIPMIYFSDVASMYKSLAAAKNIYSQHSMVVCMYPEIFKRSGVLSRFYIAGVNDESSTVKFTDSAIASSTLSKPYGMCRILDLKQVLSFLVEDKYDCNFSIYIKNYPCDGIVTRFISKAGVLNSKELTFEDAERESGQSVASMFSQENITALLLRKKDTTGLIKDILGIPRLGFNMSLMLD